MAPIDQLLEDLGAAYARLEQKRFLVSACKMVAGHEDKLAKFTEQAQQAEAEIKGIEDQIKALAVPVDERN